MSKEFKQQFLKKKSYSSPFTYVNGEYVLTSPITTIDFAQGKTGFRFEPNGKKTKAYIFGGNTTVYDATITDNDSSEFDDIQAAINAGRKTIRVRSGRYKLTRDLIIPTGVSISGEDKATTIIETNDNGIIYLKPSVRVDNVGTVSVSSGSTTVTGSGTSFITNGVKAGDTLWKETSPNDTQPAEIKSVDSETQLTLVSGYRWTTLSASAFEAKETKKDIVLTDFTINDTSTFARLGSAAPLFFAGVKNGYISNVDVTGDNQIYTAGFFFQYCWGNFMEKIRVLGGAKTGMASQLGSGNNFYDIDVDNLERGIELQYEYRSNIAFGKIEKCSLAAITLYFGEGNEISSENIYDCDSAIFVLGETALNINNCTIEELQKSGMSLYQCQELVVNSSIIKNYSQETNDTFVGIDIDRLSATELENDFGFSAAAAAIIAAIESKHNLVTGNNIQNNKTNKGKHCILESSNSSKNSVQSNIGINAVTSDFSINGTGSVQANNLT